MSEIESETAPEVHIDLIERGDKARAGHIPCVVNEDIEFSTHKLETYCLSQWEPLVFDIMLVAAAVEFCDHIQRRPALGWARRISVRIPVHEPERWNNPRTLQYLIEAVEFVTGDRWDISFGSRRHKEAAPNQNPLRMPSGVSAVIPYSNGLDSFAVGALMKRQMADKVLRVRLGPAGDRHKLAKGREPFASIPYRVRHDGIRSVETSARSRGFKFAMISGLAAYLVKAQTVIVPESGQGALGSTLVTVGHAYEDYRNHPLFTQRMELFLASLFDHKLQFSFPRLWHTKGETLKQYLNNGDAQALLKTRSCWQDRRMVSLGHKLRQCGICAACMLRRTSLHAASLTEPQGTYVWEDLSRPSFKAATPDGVKRGKRAQEQYAIAGTLHMDHLANLLHSQADAEPLKRRTKELAEALGLPEQEASKNLRRLLVTHEAEWTAFLGNLQPKSFILNWTAKPHEHAA